ncbi:ExeM/NucH family extracellular endonuclease [soil metagenome]
MSRMRLHPALRALRVLAVVTLAVLPAGCDGFLPASPQVVAIGAVQGAGDTSPMVGREVIVEGVVTAHFDGIGGFFLQSPSGEDDGDPATSDGIFVTSGSLPVPPGPVGHLVRVRGEVAELGDAPPTLTAVLAAEFDDLGPVGLDAVEVAVVSDTPASAVAWSGLEGMLVRIEAPLTVSGTSGLQRFGEVITSFGGRLYQPTELHPPGPEADALAARNAAATLVLDDGSPEQWPESVPWLPGWPDHDAPFRAGSVLEPVTGVMDARRGAYLLLPVSPVSVAEPAVRPPPPQVGGMLRIGVLNVENLFNGDGRGDGFPTPRGAATPELYRVQQAKLVETVQALDVEILALSEVENDGAGPLTALAAFVRALNEAGPIRDWRAIEVADGPGGDAIRVALVYRSSRVRPVGPAVFPDDPIFEWGSRPPLGQAFEPVGGDGAAAAEGAEVPGLWLIVANHLKSKGGCPEEGHPRASLGDFDLGDGQACWNAHRVTAAAALGAWMDADPTGTGSRNALIVGDLNSYASEDPIGVLADLGWRDVFTASGHERPYSYVFQGQAGRLDHVFIRETGVGNLRGTAIWHSNADEFTGFGYEYDPVPTVWRSSDHDVLVVGLGW